jgi:hypothetical protein
MTRVDGVVGVDGVMNVRLRVGRILKHIESSAVDDG